MWYVSIPENLQKSLRWPMPQDPAHYPNPSESQADFTYTITVKEIKIEDTGKGKKSVADYLEAALRKIEGWHQGSINSFKISYRDTQEAWHQVSWNGREATEKAAS
jgi:hypothetical protein